MQKIKSSSIHKSGIRLCLIVTMLAYGGHVMAAPEAIDATARWAEQAFSGSPAKVQGNQLTVVHNDDPVLSQVKLNQSATGKPLRLADKTYTRGFGLNAKVVLHVVLENPARRLLADIGVDRNADRQVASVRFRVSAGGKELFVSDVLRPGSQQSIDVPLDGAKTLDLIVDDGGDGRAWDQANWGDPRIELEDGTTLALDELAEQGGPVPGIPFSFVYGGKPSSELLPKWKRETKEEQADATRTIKTLSFTDPETGLVVKAIATIYRDTPGVDWTLYFSNNGSKPTPIIEKVRAVDVAFTPPLGTQVMLNRVRGCHHGAASWQPIKQAVMPGAPVAFGADGGRPAKVDSPFFTVNWAGGGVITAVGWSGQWNGSVATDLNALRIEAGMEFLHVSLQPGESIRSPRILQVFWEGGDLDWAHNQFRHTVFAHIIPQRDGKPVLPPMAHTGTSFYEENATDEAATLSHIASMDGLGFEAFWLDAYWHRGGFPAGIGNYGFPLDRVGDPLRFPRGLKPVTDAVQKEGLKFILWFEPERVVAGTAIDREHPEWVLKHVAPNGGLYDVGNPDAREFMTRYLKAAVKEYGIDILRFDYNIDPLPYWQEANRKNPERVGISEIRYVEGLYQMWDELRSAFPKLDIDNCASGGMRVDLETVSRAITLWRTDYTIEPLLRKDYDEAALRNQVMTAGLNRYLPFSVSGQMGYSPYHFRSGYNGGIAFCEDTRPADYPREQLRDAIAEGKRLRKYYMGDFYPLSDVTTDPRDWTVMQYHLPETNEGVVIGFRRHNSPFTAIQCELKGIDPAANYKVTRSLASKQEAPFEMKGADLQRLSLEIPLMPGSVILEYQKFSL